MNIPLDHECFKWNYSTGYNNSGTRFYFSFVGNEFGWVDIDSGVHHPWPLSLEELEEKLLINNYYKHNIREAFCGPLQPLPSKVILKIREMEKRYVQCRG